jgi:hypothetical protein
MRKFAILFLSAAGICGPFAANAALMQNSPVAQNTSSVISVSGASDISNGLSYQVAHLNGEVSTLQQQVQSILQQPTVMAQAPAPLYPESLGG